jgi:hypothetical protein
MFNKGGFLVAFVTTMNALVHYSFPFTFLV